MDILADRIKDIEEFLKSQTETDIIAAEKEKIRLEVIKEVERERLEEIKKEDERILLEKERVEKAKLNSEAILIKEEIEKAVQNVLAEQANITKLEDKIRVLQE